MNAKMSMKDIQAMAYSENLVKEEHVYVSLYDNLTMVRRTKVTLESIKKTKTHPVSARAIAVYLSQLGKGSGAGTQFRNYTAIEINLCDEGKALLQEDAQRHVRALDCVFSRNNMYSTNLYDQNPVVQVSVMKRMLAKAEVINKARAKEKLASRVVIEIKQVNQWVAICQLVQEQIQLSDAKLSTLAEGGKILQWGPIVNKMVAEAYQAAWTGKYDAEIEAVVAKDKKQMCKPFDTLHKLIMSEHEPKYDLTYEEEQEWKKKCNELEDQQRNTSNLPPMPLRSELTEAQRNHKAKKMKESEAAAKRAAQLKVQKQKEEQKKVAQAKKRRRAQAELAKSAKNRKRAKIADKQEVEGEEFEGLPNRRF